MAAAIGEPACLRGYTRTLQFAAVELAPGAPGASAAVSSPPRSQTATQATPSPSGQADSLIGIVLPSGILVRVGADVDGLALRRVLGALEGR